MECKLSLNEVLSQLSSWELTNDGREAVVKEFKFTDFKSAFSFMTSIALKSEEVGHHPESVSYTHLTLPTTD